MFDSLILADWPRGLYLAKQLSLNNKKVAYIEQLPRLKNPFALSLNEQSQKEFLESLGFLSRQKGGFCLLSPEKIWPLQDMRDMKDRHASIKNFTCSFKKTPAPLFKDNWLSYLSLNLSAKVFEDNNSIFQNKGINLMTDYFLFEPSAKKMEEFKNIHPNISFWTTQDILLSFNKQQVIFSLKDKPITAKKIFCLTSPDSLSKRFKPVCKAHWQWQAYYLRANFINYKEIIPSHFIFLKNIFLPWSYDNLLSVFHREDILEIWMKLKPQEEPASFIKQSKKHLKDFFQGCDLKYVNKPITKGFKVYGKESLNVNFSKQNIYIENNRDFFHGDLASEIYNEHELFKKSQTRSV